MQKSQHTRRYRQLLDALKNARKQAKLTQKQVAKKLGTYASYISKCESGERRIDVIELADFCRVYKINIVELLQCVGVLLGTNDDIANSLEDYSAYSLGNVLRDARRHKGLTQDELAAKSDLDRTYISQLERNKKSPTLAVIFRLCNVLGVSAAQFIAEIEKVAVE